MMKKDVEKRPRSNRAGDQAGKGIVLVAVVDGEESLYSEKMHASMRREPSRRFEPQTFSFNSISGGAQCATAWAEYDFDPDVS